MITLKIFTFNDFYVNSFVLYDETGECVIIDSACHAAKEKDTLKNFIEINGLKPLKLLNTHGHIDHILGNAFIKENYQVPYLIHRADEFLVSEAVDYGKIFGFDLPQPPFPDFFIGENTEIGFGNSTLKTIH